MCVCLEYASMTSSNQNSMLNKLKVVKTKCSRHEFMSKSTSILPFQKKKCMRGVSEGDNRGQFGEWWCKSDQVN